MSSFLSDISIWHLIGLLTTLLGSALFSAAETAFTSLSDMQIRLIQAKYPLRGKILSYLTPRYSSLLSTILIGNTATNFIFSVISTDLTLKIFGNQALALVSGIMIFLTLIFGEITPKQLALQYNRQYITIIIIPLFLIFTLLRPLAYILSLFSKIFIKPFISDSPTLLSGISKEHFIKLFYQARSSGIFKSANVSMVTRLLSMGELPINQIITHRTDIISLSSNNSIEESFHYVKSHPFDIFPVYLKDDKEHVTGIVEKKDILTHKHSNKNILSLSKKPLFVIEHDTIEEVFHIFKQDTHTMGIVLDEYGGVLGLVTLDDIITYLLGIGSPIEHPTQIANLCIKIDKSRYLLDASMSIGIIADIAGVPLDSTIESRTVRGYLQELLDNLPFIHQVISTPFGEMKVDRIKDNRIIAVIWSPLEEVIPHVEEMILHPINTSHKKAPLDSKIDTSGGT